MVSIRYSLHPPTRHLPVSAYELYRIYGDKTWTWNNGGGR
ncbi:DUF995 domain-containing protein, partial [Rhizobium ruizarguesonis]